MKRTRCILFLLALLVPGFPAVAQDAEPWEVLLLHIVADSREVVRVTPDGLETLAALPDSFEIGPGGLALSPDRLQAATLSEDGTRVVLADLGTGTCCLELPFLDEAPAAFSPSLAGFSPDGTRVAVAFLIEAPYRAEILVLDVESGEVVAMKDERVPPESGGVVYYPTVEGWTESGISYWTACTYCVPEAVDYRLWLWDPASAETTGTDLVVTDSGDVLALTGEQIMPAYDSRYPSLPLEDGVSSPELYGIRNVIRLHGARAEEGSDVVYFDGGNLQLDRARWVADGGAFIVFSQDDSRSVLVPADGPRSGIGFLPHQFVRGTPVGWLTLEDAGDIPTLFHYTVAGDQVERRPIAPFGGRLAVLGGTPLGASARASFQVIPPPAPTTCPGSAESRLVPGQRGRVAPGPANNVRAEPSTASRIVAKMAGNEVFDVLEGPVCAQGMAWWRVRFQQWEGWTAEGSGDTYWLLPE